MPAAANQATIRVNNAVSNVRPAADGLRPNPTTHACAGSAITSSVSTTTSTVPPDGKPLNLEKSHGQTVAENTPASTAVNGVGESFKGEPIRERKGRMNHTTAKIAKNEGWQRANCNLR